MIRIHILSGKFHFENLSAFKVMEKVKNIPEKERMKNRIRILEIVIFMVLVLLFIFTLVIVSLR